MVPFHASSSSSSSSSSWGERKALLVGRLGRVTSGIIESSLHYHFQELSQPSRGLTIMAEEEEDGEESRELDEDVS